MVYSTTLGLLMAASAAVAQTGGQPAFEVASVKPMEVLLIDHAEKIPTAN
jgi:hypothetical protein